MTPPKLNSLGLLGPHSPQPLKHSMWVSYYPFIPALDSLTPTILSWCCSLSFSFFLFYIPFTVSASSWCLRSLCKPNTYSCPLHVTFWQYLGVASNRNLTWTRINFKGSQAKMKLSLKNPWDQGLRTCRILNLFPPAMCLFHFPPCRSSLVYISFVLGSKMTGLKCLGLNSRFLRQDMGWLSLGLGL